LNTVNCNSTSKNHDIAVCWTCQAIAASAIMQLHWKANNTRIAATDCTKIVLICHERDLFCRLHGRVQALDLRIKALFSITSYLWTNCVRTSCMGANDGKIYDDKICEDKLCVSKLSEDKLLRTR
jgi:hypothetical protein